jgi:hypothetical protein
MEGSALIATLSLAMSVLIAVQTLDWKFAAIDTLIGSLAIGFMASRIKSVKQRSKSHRFAVGLGATLLVSIVAIPIAFAKYEQDHKIPAVYVNCEGSNFPIAMPSSGAIYTIEMVPYIAASGGFAGEEAPPGTTTGAKAGDYSLKCEVSNSVDTPITALEMYAFMGYKPDQKLPDGSPLAIKPYPFMVNYLPPKGGGSFTFYVRNNASCPASFVLSQTGVAIVGDQPTKSQISVREPLTGINALVFPSAHPMVRSTSSKLCENPVASLAKASASKNPTNETAHSVVTIDTRCCSPSVMLGPRDCKTALY